MMLSAKAIVDQGIVTKVTEENIAQVGVDLNVIDIRSIHGRGRIYKDIKTRLPSYVSEPLRDGFWVLYPGAYDIVFKQGCKFPADKTGFLIQRSSLGRIGGHSVKSVFDPGFETEHIGTIMIVTATLEIEKGSRLMQMVVFDSMPLAGDELYGADPSKSQFQGDRQRIDHED